MVKKRNKNGSQIVSPSNRNLNNNLPTSAQYSFTSPQLWTQNLVPIHVNSYIDKLIFNTEHNPNNSTIFIWSANLTSLRLIKYGIIDKQ